MRDRPDARAAELEVGTYYCACAIRTKWRLIHPETPVELSVSLFDSLTEFICSKGLSRLVIESFGVKTIVFSQTNSSVGVMKKKKKKRWRKSRLDRFPCITVAVYFSYFGSVIG